MAYKTIVTVVNDLETNKSALDAAIALATREEAHLDILCLGIDRTQPGFYYAGASAVVLQDNLAQAQAEAEALEAKLKERMAGEDLPYAIFRATVQIAGMAPLVAHRTRMADLAVLPQPYAGDRAHENEAILEAVLFNGAVPVLVIPNNKALPESLSNVVVAWNESTESLTAIRAALPFLQQADLVNITVIDPPAHSPDRSDPGGQLSQVLSRHGVRPEVSVLAKTMPRISDILCRHAGDTGADMIVMGAYGHSRFREAILGGATRNMLEIAEVPVLMAH
ncbi:universal stress protein [Pseudoruegeria sp. HB172150]|uniref:universal stress protein n=1 Tax=Pseudoruegeria sp. HB172150 TaxID=2721164 RepID=UPI0015571133|nr:universal stress protein [Pseudoruegeria sp. HB172150]